MVSDIWLPSASKYIGKRTLRLKGFQGSRGENSGVADRAREVQACTVRRLLTGLLLVLALVLTGCVKITNQTHSQQQQIGDVRLTTTFCLSDTAGGATCPEEDTNSERPAGGDHARLLLGYRVPTAAAGPATISVSSTDPAGTLTLSPS